MVLCHKPQFHPETDIYTQKQWFTVLKGHRNLPVARQGKANYPLASRPSHNPKLRERALNSHSHGLEPAASIHSSLAARSTQWRGGAVDHTSPAPSASVTHFLNGLLLIYRPRKDERLSWPIWLTYSGQFTHELVTCLIISQVQDRESSPVNLQVIITK